MFFWKFVVVVVVFLFVIFIVQVVDYMVGDLIFSNVWIWVMFLKVKVGGGFVEIVNVGVEVDWFVFVGFWVVVRVEFYEMFVIDGIMKMWEMENGIDIFVGKIVILKLGGLYIMFMGLIDGFEEGGSVFVVLMFEKVGDVEIVLLVVKMGVKFMGYDYDYKY